MGRLENMEVAWADSRQSSSMYAYYTTILKRKGKRESGYWKREKGVNVTESVDQRHLEKWCGHNEISGSFREIMETSGVFQKNSQYFHLRIYVNSNRIERNLICPHAILNGHMHIENSTKFCPNIILCCHISWMRKYHNIIEELFCFFMSGKPHGYIKRHASSNCWKV